MDNEEVGRDVISVCSIAKAEVSCSHLGQRPSNLNQDTCRAVVDRSLKPGHSGLYAGNSFEGYPYVRKHKTVKGSYSLCWVSDAFNLPVSEN